jgi:hypothetical protein
LIAYKPQLEYLLLLSHIHQNLRISSALGHVIGPLTKSSNIQTETISPAPVFILQGKCDL